MLPGKVNDAPSAIALLDVRERERRHLRPSEAASHEYGKDGPVTQALQGGESGALSRTCACRRDNQLPVRIPTDFTPLTRRMLGQAEYPDDVFVSVIAATDFGCCMIAHF